MLWICDDCTTAYNLGAVRCPHCGSTARHPQGEESDVAKNRVHGGPTNRGDGLTPVPSPAEELPTGPVPVPGPVGNPADDLVEVEDEVIEAPVRSARREAWVDYVEALGGEVAGSDTKADLIARAEVLADPGGEEE